MTATLAINEAVAWHDTECGVYAADLPLWERLAGRAPGPVLELGCGTGRVSLRLAAAGHKVIGLDRDPELLAALRERAGSDDRGHRTIQAEVTELSTARRFGLVAAPMQLAQLLDRAARQTMLGRVAAHLKPDGIAAFAVAELPSEPWHPSRESPPPAPDVREYEGWIFSSLPIAVEPDPEGVTIRRLRQLVSPAGVLHESQDTVRLMKLSPAGLEQEAHEVGLTMVERQEVAETADHLGSTIVVMELSR